MPLVRDARDPTLLVGSYLVAAGNQSAALKVLSFTQSGKDLAGNALSTDLVADASKIGAGTSVVVDGVAPDPVRAFQLDPLSDLGASARDGLTSETLPRFKFQGLLVGAGVEVTAKLNGVEQVLLRFNAIASEQTVAVSKPLVDGTYTDVSVRQVGATGNPSEKLALGNTKESGAMQISTAAPGVAANLVFDEVQDRLSEKQYELYQINPAGVTGTVPRDFVTTIQQPRFNFTGGEDGQTAVLFRDRNANNRFDEGDVMLGRKLIGDDSKTTFTNPNGVRPASLAGHFVDVAAENALANGIYTDIKLVLQSSAGALGAASAAAFRDIIIDNEKPAPTLTSVKATPVAGDARTSANSADFTVVGGAPGARVSIRADVTASDGSTTSGVLIGSGLLDGDKVRIDSSRLDGRYFNFKAFQTYAGKDSATVTVSSKEITRYNQNNVKTDKVKQQDEDADQPVVMEDGEKAPAAAVATTGVSGNTAAPDFSPVKSPDNQQQLADVEINSKHEKNWGVQWPLAAGALALLAAAAGGGGGGGAAGATKSAAGGGEGASTGAGLSPQAEVKAVISGAAMLGPLNNAFAIAYDGKGNVLSEAAQVVDGHYALVLNQIGYRGTLLIVVRDNTPGLPDNYADEASLKLTDLGPTPLRALVNASGTNQTVNVTALTELAVIKAGLDLGSTNPSEVEGGLTAQRIAAANNAVGSFFKVDAIAGEVVPTTVLNGNGQVISNPGFNPGISSAAYNYGAALKAMANLVLMDNKSYPNQIEVIQKLANTLQFVDASNTALKWATNGRGMSLASSNLMQSHLFSEPLLKIIEDPNSSPAAVESASARYKALQDLPGGSSVANYLQQNHVAIAEPRQSIKHAVMSNPEVWQSAPSNATLELDQGDFLEGGLGVSTPPYAAVNVVLEGKDGQGRAVRISFPAARADESGRAVLSTDTAVSDLLLRLDPMQPVFAEVTISDGYNNRTNYAVWKANADVRVDLNTPPGMTDFVSPMPALVSDTSYAGRAGDDGRRVPGQRGESDKITRDGSLRVSLTKALANDERLQFAVATSVDDSGRPVFGAWKEAGKLEQGGSNARGGVDYLASDVVQTNGSNWVKVRVVLVGPAYTGGYGNANTAAETLQFTLDTLAPPQLTLQFAAARDDGLSTSDGITSQRGAQLIPLAAPEAGAELHFRLGAGSGTDARTLQLLFSSGATQDVVPSTWYELKAGDRLLLNGDTVGGNGKAQLLLRHIDVAGNFTEYTQRFVVDSSGLIQYTALLANSEKAVNDALAAVSAAQAAFDSADAGSKPARQATLAAAQSALTRAQLAENLALEQARAALINSDGTTRLDSIMGSPVEKDYVPAIINAVAATADVDKVSDAVSLKALVRAAIQAADAAVAKAAVYGDDPAFAAPTLADFKAMGIIGVNNAQQLAAINDVLKALPQSRSDSIAEIQATVRAYYKVLALADGKPDNTDVGAYPTVAEYAALGVTSALSEAGARILGGAIDGKDAASISTVARLNELAAAAHRIAQQAALPAGQALTVPLTVTDFERLGVIGASDDNVAEIAASLNSVPQKVIESGAVVGAVDTLAEVQALVSFKIGSLQTILNHANGTTPINPLRPSQKEPILSDYQNAELSGNAGNSVNVANLASINSAVKAVGAEAVSSWKKLAALVQSYNLILASADGVGGNAVQLPGAEDYARVGVQALQNAFPQPGAARGNALSLLNQVLDGMTRGEIDSSSKLDRLASVAARVVALAAGQKVVLSADELNTLHLPAVVTPAQLPVVLSGIAGTADDGGEVRSPAMLAEVAARALAASARITSYADDVAQPAPVLADYHTLGIRGVDDDLHLDALNSALATPTVDGKRVGVPAQLQEIADAYGRILAQAGDVSGSRAAPALKDYALIGAPAPHDEHAKALINSALVGKTPRELAGVSKLSQLVAAANTLQALAAGDGSALQGSTDADQAADLKARLELLGVVNLNDALQASVAQAIVASADDGSAIDTLPKLQALVDAAIQSQLKINAYADDAGRALPNTADYAAIGVGGVNADNLGAINSALASKPVSAIQTATPALVQGIVDAYGRILAAADGRGGNASALPQVQDYQRVGLAPELVAAMQPAADGTHAPLQGMLNTLVDLQPAAGVNTLASLSTLAGTAQHLIAQARATLGDALVSQGEMATAGITGLDPRTFPAVLAAIAASADDGSGLIGSLPAGQLKLQALADNAHRAQLKIQSFADGIANAPAPTLADYRSIGIDLAVRLPHAPVELAVKAINSALQTTTVGAAQVNPPSALAEIVNAYDLVLAAADGRHGRWRRYRHPDRRRQGHAGGGRLRQSQHVQAGRHRHRLLPGTGQGIHLRTDGDPRQPRQLRHGLVLQGDLDQAGDRPRWCRPGDHHL